MAFISTMEIAAKSAANNETQGAKHPLNIVNNEIQGTDGLTAIANNEIPGMDGAATSGQDDVPLSSHDTPPGMKQGQF